LEWLITAGTGHPNTRPFLATILLQQLKTGQNGLFLIGHLKTRLEIEWQFYLQSGLDRKKQPF
jgi:hypothetical protein